MKNYEFCELNEIVVRIFSNYRRDAKSVGMNIMQTIERFFYDYDCVIAEGLCEAAIVCSTLAVELNKVQEKSISKRHYDELMNILKNYDSSKMKGCIEDHEIEDLSNQVAKAIEVLNNMEIIE